MIYSTISKITVIPPRNRNLYIYKVIDYQPGVLLGTDMKLSTINKILFDDLSTRSFLLEMTSGLE